MTTSEIKKALNTEFRLDTVKRFVEQINANNYKSHTSTLKLDLLRYNLDVLIMKCDSSEAIELVEKRQDSVRKALRKLNT